jgi:hypothetical protein
MVLWVSCFELGFGALLDLWEIVHRLMKMRSGDPSRGRHGARSRALLGRWDGSQTHLVRVLIYVVDMTLVL